MYMVCSITRCMYIYVCGIQSKSIVGNSAADLFLNTVKSMMFYGNRSEFRVCNCSQGASLSCALAPVWLTRLSQTGARAQLRLAPLFLCTEQRQEHAHCNLLDIKICKHLCIVHCYNIQSGPDRVLLCCCHSVWPCGPAGTTGEGAQYVVNVLLGWRLACRCTLSPYIAWKFPRASFLAVKLKLTFTAQSQSSEWVNPRPKHVFGVCAQWDTSQDCVTYGFNLKSLWPHFL